MKSLVIVLLLLPALVQATHVRGHPDDFLILEVPGTPTNGVSCAEMNKTFTVKGSNGITYTLIPLAQCWYLTAPMTYNGITFPAGRYYNLWQRL